MAYSLYQQSWQQNEYLPLYSRYCHKSYEKRQYPWKNNPTPGGEINGNFCDIFEAGGKIYAVDSLSHLGLASTTIYSFDCDCKYHKIFSDENLGFKARYATGERAYILVSGSVSTRSGGEKLKSILLEISENGIDAKTEFDCGFYLVFNMIVKNGKMILGVDKAVVTADLQTKEIKAYTPISVEAEKHIIGISRWISPVNLADDRTFLKQCLLI